MDLQLAQRELRDVYVSGGPGAIVSGIIWLAAAITASVYDIGTGFAVLFFGGMLIFPLSAMVVRVFFRRGAVSKENQGGLMVIETVFPMIGLLFAAWLILPFKPHFVFPLAAIGVGAHYFGFRSAYGLKFYWVFGGCLCALGILPIIFNLPSAELVPYLVGLIEILFGVWLTFDNVSQLSADG